MKLTQQQIRVLEEKGKAKKYHAFNKITDQDVYYYRVGGRVFVWSNGLWRKVRR